VSLYSNENLAVSKTESNLIIDKPLLQQVYAKLDLYKQLTKLKVNEMLKRQWFEVVANEMGSG